MLQFRLIEIHSLAFARQVSGVAGALSVFSIVLAPYPSISLMTSQWHWKLCQRVECQSGALSSPGGALLSIRPSESSFPTAIALLLPLRTGAWPTHRVIPGGSDTSQV